MGLATAAALTRARPAELAPVEPPDVATPAAPAPAEALPPKRSALEQVRVARPGLHKFYVAAIGVNLVLAALFGLAATAEPLLLVMVAESLGLAGVVWLAAWTWVKTTPPRVRRQMEERVAAQQAAQRDR